MVSLLFKRASSIKLQNWTIHKILSLPKSLAPKPMYKAPQYSWDTQESQSIFNNLLLASRKCFGETVYAHILHDNMCVLHCVHQSLYMHYFTLWYMVHPTWITDAQLDMGSGEVNTWYWANIRNHNELTSGKLNLACIWLSLNGKWKTVCKQEQIKSECNL